VRIADPESGVPLPEAGSVGMIEVRGPNVFRGYWRMPEKTCGGFRQDGFFITGDVGRFDRQRLSVHRRARQGPDHQRRLQRLSGGSGDGAGRIDRRGGERGHRRAASRLR
jgi:acyl-CoA synthetase (AMP-forming)/AMP-acid ligase II